MCYAKALFIKPVGRFFWLGAEGENSETRRTINTPLRRIGKEPQFAEEAAEQIGSASVRIRPDRYYGPALAIGVHQFPENREKALAIT